MASPHGKLAARESLQVRRSPSATLTGSNHVPAVEPPRLARRLAQAQSEHARGQAGILADLAQQQQARLALSSSHPASILPSWSCCFPELGANPFIERRRHAAHDGASPSKHCGVSHARPSLKPKCCSGTEVRRAVRQVPPAHLLVQLDAKARLVRQHVVAILVERRVALDQIVPVLQLDRVRLQCDE